MYMYVTMYTHPLFSPPLQSLLELTPRFKIINKKKNAAIPKHIL